MKREQQRLEFEDEGRGKDPTKERLKRRYEMSEVQKMAEELNEEPDPRRGLLPLSTVTDLVNQVAELVHAEAYEEGAKANRRLSNKRQYNRGYQAGIKSALSDLKSLEREGYKFQNLEPKDPVKPPDYYLVNAILKVKREGLDSVAYFLNNEIDGRELLHFQADTSESYLNFCKRLKEGAAEGQ